MLDFDKIVSSASLPEDTVPICLDGRLVRQYEEVRNRVESRQVKADPTPTGPVPLGVKTGPQRDPEQDELDRLTAAIEAANVPFVVRAMSRDAFVEFTARPEFQPRKDRTSGEIDPRDARMGLNTQTFVPGLVEASLVDPDLSVEGRWERLRHLLTGAQMGRLFTAAWSINQEDRDIPFSPGGSPSQRNSDHG